MTNNRPLFPQMIILLHKIKTIIKTNYVHHLNDNKHGKYIPNKFYQIPPHFDNACPQVFKSLNSQFSIIIPSSIQLIHYNFKLLCLIHSNETQAMKKHCMAEVFINHTYQKLFQQSFWNPNIMGLYLTKFSRVTPRIFKALLRTLKSKYRKIFTISL